MVKRLIVMGAFLILMMNSSFVWAVDFGNSVEDTTQKNPAAGLTLAEDQAVKQEGQPNKTETVSSQDKSSKAEGGKRSFLERLKQVFGTERETPYKAAPYTPMQLNLQRPERFGVHLHNIEFRFMDQPGPDITPGQTRDQFQIPASELEFSGSLLPELLFAQVVIDPRDLNGRGLGDSIAANIPPGNNKPSGILRDAFFDIMVDEPFLLRLGQQRIPFGIEAQTPGGLLPFINRAYLDLKLTHYAGDPENDAFKDAEMIQERDIGIQARGTVLESPHLDYAVGVFNGAGINVNDTNNTKDIVGRIGFAPHPGLRFGVSGYKGTQVDILAQSGPREREGADFEINQNLIPRFRLMGEAATGQDGPFKRRAWYVSGFYELIPQKTPTSPGLLLASRYEVLQDNERFSRGTVGLTYYLLNAVETTTGYWKQIKFQFNYEFRKHPIAGTATAVDAFARNLLLAQATVRY